MSTFAKAGFKSSNYNSFRPKYPASFYKTLMEYVGKPKVNNTIDLGCGTGQATFELLKFSKNVVGLDLSPSMIKTANSLVGKKLEDLGIDDASRISFQVSAVEDFEAPPESFDLITCAECIHWFKDYDTFFRSAASQLTPGGVLAYWYYVDPVIVSFSGSSTSALSDVAIKDKAMEIYRKYVYADPAYLGPHWEQPGRFKLQNFLVETDKHIPNSLFKDVKTKKYVPRTLGDVTFADDDLQLFRKEIKLQDFSNYLSTYSSYHAYSENNNGPELLEKIVSEMESQLGWNRDTTLLDIEWYAGYTFMTKR